MSVLPYRLRRLLAVRPGLKLYEGARLDDGHPALIQHLLPEASPTTREERFADFLRMAEGLAAAPDPCLPTHLFHTTSPGDPFYLATEMPVGTSLQTLLGKVERLDWREALGVVRPLARALSGLHERGVAHLTLRPEVILLRRQSEPLLLEAGLGPLLLRAAERPLRIADAQWPRIFPVPQLVAPELLRPEGATGEVDDRADVLALGVLLFRLVTGRWPYEDGTSLRVYNQARAGVRDDVLAPALAHLPEALQQTIRRATAVDPDGRHANAGELAEALVDREEASLAPAVAELVRDAPYADGFGHLLSVVDGGPRPCPATKPPAPAPAEDDAPDAEANAERERQLRLADIQLQAMRSSRRSRERGSLLKWVLLVAVIAAFAIALPPLLNRGRGTRVYPGGVDPTTGLTHAAPPPTHRAKKKASPLRRGGEPEAPRARWGLAP